MPVTNFIQKSKNTYNKKATYFDKTLEGKITRKLHLFLLANMILQDNDFVVDVACGNGTLLASMNKVKPIKGSGIDISDQMIRIASKNHTTLKFHVADCENIPYANNTVDLITVCTGYHHFPNVDAFAKESARVLKAGGNIYIAEIYLPPVLREICNLFLPLLRTGDVKFYSEKEIIQVFHVAKFHHRKTVTKGYMQLIQLEKK